MARARTILTTTLGFNTPFDSYLVPGLFLGIVVGGSAAAGAVTSFARTRRSLHLSAAAGVILVGWIAGETILIEAFSWLQGRYLLSGVLVIALAARIAFITGWSPRDLMRVRPDAGAELQYLPPLLPR